jgi:mono/diheme cytochrome c family protein
MQGGYTVMRFPDMSLRSTTAGAGGAIFRGDRLPKELMGDYFYGEEVARIVRRVHPETREGLTYIRNAYNGNEFIKSTDPLFRPVDQKVAPDGTLYIVDMYHGIIQEAAWTGPGTYLRGRIQQYDLDKVIHKGRIWRLVYDGVKRGADAIDRDKTPPHMLNETSAQLVAHLTHPNGWWRDTAQQLLVLKHDKSVVPALTSLVKTSPNLLGRIHAMWTLEGLGALDAALVRQLMEDKEPRMRIQAIRASETLYKAGDRSFAADYKKAATDPSVDVVIQSMLTVNRWKVPDANTVIKTTADSNKAKGVQVVAMTMLNPDAAAGGRGGGGGGRGGGAALTPEQQNIIERGGQIYRELCFTCHGDDGFGTPRPEGNTTMGPPLAGSPRVNGHRDYVVNAVLHGLTGPVDDRTYTEVMIPMDQNNDEWVASVASYVRRSFGNSGGFVTPADVARVRAATAARKAPWTVADLQASLPTVLVDDGTKLTASHNANLASRALTLTGWTSGSPQQAGMWFQLELSKPAMITEIQFDSTSGGGRGGGGGGGRGGVAAGAPGAAPGAAAAATVATGNGGRGGGRGAAAGAAGTPGAAAAEVAQAAPAAPPANPGFPRGYKVELSMDGTAWKTVAEGKGDGASTDIMFAPAQAKFVRITQTATVDSAPVWSIQGLRLFEPGKAAGK